jgi:hypothetical protein
MSPIIRTINILLAIAWYTAIISLIIVGFVATVEGIHNPVPLYWAKVRVNGIGPDQEIRLAATGENLISSEFWTSTRQWPNRHNNQLPMNVLTGYWAIRPPNFLWSLIWIITVAVNIGFMLAVIFCCAASPAPCLSERLSPSRMPRACAASAC